MGSLRLPIDSELWLQHGARKARSHGGRILSQRVKLLKWANITSSDQGIRRSGRFYFNFRQDMTNFWTSGTYIFQKTTEEQPVSKAACVSKEGRKINHFQMKFISLML
jgi:hypothetical protein